MKRRWISLLLATTLCVSLASGCSSKDPKKEKEPQGNTDDGSSVVTLRVWGATEDEQLLNQMFDSFKAEYSDTSFDIVLEGVGEANCKDTLLNDVLNAPDVFTFADDQLNAMVAAGVLSPVEDADSVKSANLENAVIASSVNDTLYAYPMTADNGYFLYYDKSVFSDEDVKTMDGLLAAADKAGKKVYMDWSSGWYLYSFFGQTGLEVGLNDDGISNYCNWNATDNAVKGVDVANAMMAIAKNPGFNTDLATSLVDGAASGKFAAGVSGVWDASALKELWGDNLGATKLPTYTVGDKQVQMSSFAGYKMIGVNSYSRNVEWAHKLADWLTNEQNQNLRFAERELGPSNINASSNEAVQEAVAIQALIEQSEFSRLQRIGGNYWTPVSNFGLLMLTGSSGGTDIQKYMDNMVEAITASNGS